MIPSEAKVLQLSRGGGFSVPLAHPARQEDRGLHAM